MVLTHARCKPCRRSAATRVGLHSSHAPRSDPEFPDTRRPARGECGFARLWTEVPDARVGDIAECQDSRTGTGDRGLTGVAEPRVDHAGGEQRNARLHEHVTDV
jgi:hypothetical protein